MLCLNAYLRVQSAQAEEQMTFFMILGHDPPVLVFNLGPEAHFLLYRHLCRPLSSTISFPI